MKRRTFLKAALLTEAAWPIRFEALAQAATPATAPRKLTLGAPLTHSDWMLKPGMKWGEEGVRHMLDASKACGWSKVYWRVFDGGRALYRSQLLRPQGKWDEDNFWNPKTDEDKALLLRYTPGMTTDQRTSLRNRFEALDYSTFDSFGAAVEYGHQIGLKIHAWATLNEDDHGWGIQSEFSKQHPELRWRRRNGKFYRSQLSFAFPEVQQFKLGLLKELLAYDLDGVFFDWIRTGDVRDTPQTDADGTADNGYEEPLVVKFQREYKLPPTEVPNDDERWVRIRAEPQTEFMRAARELIRTHRRELPVSALAAHPWHYRGEQNKIAGNLRGLLLDVATWAREGLIDSVVAAGYYRDGGNAEMAWRALQKETGGKVDVWTYAWVPTTVAEAAQTFALADNVGAHEILFWEADYIDDRRNAAELQPVLREGAK